MGALAMGLLRQAAEGKLPAGAAREHILDVGMYV
jgi:hypothetical protein